ncbi:MAG: hypothetical protein Q7U75_16470 [Desulfobacterales bacterium]|nr:hypothetical protein [Desulfobacterales bacterium]
MPDDFLDLDAAVALTEARASTSGVLAAEVLGYLVPHVDGLRVRERDFVCDLVYKRARSLAESRVFSLSEAQLSWLLRIAYLNGFRVNDEAFWAPHRSRWRK